MLFNIIYLVHSRPMMSYHVTCHVTAVTYLFIINKKKKKIKKKRNIKSRKMLVLIHIITYILEAISITYFFLYYYFLSEDWLFQDFSLSYFLTNSYSVISFHIHTHLLI